eukprot:m.98758 g.98758  ORF g.98758 m.98758 type:complete len:461 (+) comp37011_c0_seq5:43-1425(+)
MNSKAFWLVCIFSALISMLSAIEDELELSSADEIYEEIFQLLEEKETLEHEITTLDVNPGKKRQPSTSKDDKCERLSGEVKTLQNEAEERLNQLAGLRNELKTALETRKKVEEAAKCDEEEEKRPESEFRGRYTFPTKPVEKYDASDPQALKNIQNGMPVVITGSNSTQNLERKWNLDYLSKQLGNERVRMSVSPDHKFMYYSQENEGNYKWRQTYHVQQGTFQSFVELMDVLDEADNGSRTYFQHLLRELRSSEEMDDDRADINWDFIDNVRVSSGWGPLRDNLLLVGMRDVTTPAHYNSMENLFTMVSGYKRCFLFDPNQFAGLYPYPVHHPHDRQSQVDFDNPNFDQFPKFREVEGLEAVLGPGDLLYIPAYWWHYVEAARKGTTISLNFWFLPSWNKEGASSQDSTEMMPDSVKTVFAQRRVESLIGELIHPSQVGSVLADILHRRFEFLQTETAV